MTQYSPTGINSYRDTPRGTKRYMYKDGYYSITYNSNQIKSTGEGLNKALASLLRTASDHPKKSVVDPYV